MDSSLFGMTEPLTLMPKKFNPFLIGNLDETGSSGGSVATDAIWDAAGDLAVGTGANTAARLAMGSALQVLRVNAGATALEYATLAGGGNAQTADPLSQFAATTSLQLKGVISDETGSGALVFADTPTLVTPVLGAATGTSLQLSGLTASEIVITDASKNLVSAAVATYPSLTELTYVKGATSSIQTQINAKAALVSPSFTTPSLGVATATSINKVAFTAPATSATIVATDGTTTTLSGGTHSGTNTGDQTNISGNAATVTTNANLTGPITSVGNATSIASQTGTGTKFVVDDTPTLITPVLGVATATSINKVAFTAPATSATIVATDGTSTTLSGGTHSGTNTGDNTVATALTGTPSITVASVTTTGNIELGHASDTTLSRVAAGVLAVEGETLNGFATTATAAGTTTLTIADKKNQWFTGSSTQTVKLPTTSVILGQSYVIKNISTGSVTVQSSGANTILVLGAGMSATFIAQSATPTTAAHWDFVQVSAQGMNIATTATANAATANIAYVTNTITNNSAATLTITMPTAGAVDGELRTVRILDFSAAAQTITWVNTENSTATAPVTSNGSTTLPISAGFQYNSNTSKWRCLASA